MQAFDGLCTSVAAGGACYWKVFIEELAGVVSNTPDAHTGLANLSNANRNEEMVLCSIKIH